MESTWSLHPQLATDTTPVGDLALARVLLANDANYPWLILVPRRPGLSELIDLEPNEQVQLLGEIDAAARAMKFTASATFFSSSPIGLAIGCTTAMRKVMRRTPVPMWPQPNLEPA